MIIHDLIFIAFGFTLGFWAALFTVRPRNFEIKFPRVKRNWPKEIDTEK